MRILGWDLYMYRHHLFPVKAFDAEIQSTGHYFLLFFVSSYLSNEQLDNEPELSNCFSINQPVEQNIILKK